MYRLNRQIPSSTHLHWICNEKTAQFNPSIRHNSKSASKKKSSIFGTLFTIGAVTIAGGATLAYAKYDADFRKTLGTYVPFSENMIKFVFNEKTSVIDIYPKSMAPQSIPATLVNKPMKQEAKISPIIINKSTKTTDQKEPDIPQVIRPTPLIAKNTPHSSSNSEDKKTEKPEKVEEKKIEIETPVISQNLDEIEKVESKLHKIQLNIEELQLKMNSATAEALAAYHNAINCLKSYTAEMNRIIDSSIDQIHSSTWEAIRTKTRTKNDAIEIAQKRADEAIKYILQLKEAISQASFDDIPESLKSAIETAIEHTQDEMAQIRSRFDHEKYICSAAEKFWDRVEEARKHFAEQLEILFPTIDLSKKKLKINGDDLDLFLAHVYTYIQYYQKEMAKKDQIINEKLQDTVRNTGMQMLNDLQIENAISGERRRLNLHFEKEKMKLKKEAEDELREQLKRQSQVFTDHLEEAIGVRAAEIERNITRHFSELLEAERTKYKMQLAAMVGRLRGLDRVVKAKNEAESISKQAQGLWSACQCLHRAMRVTRAGVPWRDQLRPLDEEVRMVQCAAAKDDDFVVAVLNGIPQEAKERGIYPENALRERFLKVEQLARRLALVPDERSSLIVYVLSYFQSLLLLNEPAPIPEKEINDEIIDFGVLSTYEILQRSRYWLDRGDFSQALKYMNLLKGASRAVARQWMNETRILLETQQAADTLMAHAAACGMAYL